MEKNVVRAIIKYFGYALVSQDELPLIENHIMNVVTRFNINVVLDVGANNGQFVQSMRSVGYTGKIISFEPVKETFNKLLENNKRDTNFTAEQVGLGAEPCVATINVSNISSLSSMFELTRDLGSDVYKKCDEKIHLTTIDLIFEKYGLYDKKVLLKIDTQGYDLMVVKGAINSINHIIAIVSEISFQKLYSQSPSYHESIFEFNKMGFELAGLYPVASDEKGLLCEVDGIFLNKKMLV